MDTQVPSIFLSFASYSFAFQFTFQAIMVAYYYLDLNALPASSVCSEFKIMKIFPSMYREISFSSPTSRRRGILVAPGFRRASGFLVGAKTNGHFFLILT